MSKIYKITIDKYKIIRWRFNGELHSLGDFPAVICANGTKYWYQNGKSHRDGNKPAVIYADGTKFWCQHGKYHRLTGPAIKYLNGDVEYWIEGRRLFKEQFEERIKCLKKS